LSSAGDPREDGGAVKPPRTAADAARAALALPSQAMITELAKLTARCTAPAAGRSCHPHNHDGSWQCQRDARRPVPIWPLRHQGAPRSGPAEHASEQERRMVGARAGTGDETDRAGPVLAPADRPSVTPQELAGAVASRHCRRQLLAGA
jgi:hypothetical protein